MNVLVESFSALTGRSMTFIVAQLLFFSVFVVTACPDKKQWAFSPLIIHSNLSAELFVHSMLLVPMSLFQCPFIPKAQ